MSTKSTKSVKLLTVQAEFDAAIIAMKKTGQKYDNEVQLLLASAVVMAAMHGNTNGINAVATSLSNGTRKQAVSGWLMKHAPVVAQEDADKAKTHPFKFSREKLETLMGNKNPSAEQADAYGQLIHASHWSNFKPDSVEVTEWSLTDAIQKIITQARKMGAKNVKVQGIEALPGLEALCADCGGEPGTVQSV